MQVSQSKLSKHRLDQTPRGRIMNRTVSDVAVLDGTLFNSLDNCIAGVLAFIVSFGVILVLVPLFAPVALLIACMYFYFSPPYIKSSRGESPSDLFIPIRYYFVVRS